MSEGIKFNEIPEDDSVITAFRLYDSIGLPGHVTTTGLADTYFRANRLMRPDAVKVMAVAIGHLKALLAIDPETDEGNAGCCHHCCGYLHRHVSDCPYVAAKAYLDSLELTP